MTKPPSDSRAPSLTWTATNTSTGKSDDYTHAKQGDRYFVVLKADNPGGVHQVSFDGVARWKCATKEPLPKTHDKSLVLAPQAITLAPDADGKVSTSGLVSEPVDLLLDCPGEAFDSGDVTFSGKASNYDGVTATSTLVIHVPSAWSCASSSFSLTIYSDSLEEASAKVEGACKLSGSNCGSGPPVCRPAGPCGARWGCSSDLGRTPLWDDDLSASWQAAMTACRASSTVGERTEVTCYRDIQCKCET